MYSESVITAAKELKIHDASVLVTGATGLIGSCAIDVMCAANKEQGANIHIYALGRSNEKIRRRVGDNVIPLVQDIVEPLSENRSFDYILHGVSNADPRSYATQPVETITTNLRQHRINGRIHIGGHAFCENQQDALCICSQGRTDSSCQAGPVSQNQIR